VALDAGLRWEIGAGEPDVWAAREALVWGVDQPTADTTGVLSTSVYAPSRTTQAGNFTVATGDVEYLNYDFGGKVSVTSSGRKYFRNCTFAGETSPSTEQGLLHVTNSAVSNVIVEDCDLIPDTPTAYFSGILGHHFTARRCKVRHVVDGFGVYNTAAPTAQLGVLIEMCYIVDHAWFSTAPGQSDGSHTDGCQIQGGAGMVLRGNHFGGTHDVTVGDSPWSRLSDPSYRTISALMVTPNVGAVTGMVVEKNWLDGGEICCNITKSTNAGNNIGSLLNNRFGRNTYYTGHAIDIRTGALYTASGNVYDDDDTPVRIRVY